MSKTPQNKGLQGAGSDLRNGVASIFDQSPLAVTLEDAQGAVRYSNPAYRALHPRVKALLEDGVKARDLGRSLAEIGTFDLEGMTIDEWFESRQDNEFDGPLATFDIKFADGRVIERSILAQNDGWRLVVRRDVTSERRIAREFEQLSHAYQLVFETATNGIAVLDRDRSIIHVNPAARHMLGGISTETPISWPKDIQFLDSGDLSPLDPANNPVERAISGERLRGEVHLMTRVNGTDPRYVRITSSPVDDEQSNFCCVMAFDDVSENEKNRQQIERKSRLDALGQLTGGIAHDFNNLLATTSFAIDLVRRERLSERADKYSDVALQTIRRGSELTNRLLAFAKRQPARSSSRMVSSVWEDMESLVRPTIEETIDLRFEGPPANLFVFCDQAQLDNALLNLVLNGRDAILKSGQGNSIRIQARAIDDLIPEAVDSDKGSNIHYGEGRRQAQSADRDRADGKSQRYVEISVTDNGPGMTEAVKSRAVDPFFSTKESNSGTGLGLSMVYGFVQQCDGELRIYSEVGHGTTVRLYIPRADNISGEREDPTDTSPLVKGNGEVVLIVEDETALLDVMDAAIRDLGYNTIRSISGRDAVAVLKAGAKIDLLITDIVMPGGIGGFELAKLARQIDPSLPVIYMSGYTGFSDEEMGDVVAPMLAKPSTPVDVSVMIREALDRPRP